MNTHFLLKAAIILTFISGIFTSGSYAQNNDYISAKTGKDIVFKTGNTERMRITSDGQIGISGALTTSALNVTGATSFDSLHVQNKIKIGNSIQILGYGNGSAINHIYTDASGNPTLFIQSNYVSDPNSSDNHNTIVNYSNFGKVGIGTINPAEKLDVDGNGRFGYTNGHVKIGFNTVHGFVDSDSALMINYYSGKDVVIGNNSNNEKLIVNSNVGIGTTNPHEKFEVNGSARFGNTTNYVRVGFNSVHGFVDSDSTLMINYYSGRDVVIGNNSNNEKLIVNTKVGIGTASPQANLEIQSDNNTELLIRSTSANNSSVLWTVNGAFAYGFGVDTAGIGHIFQNVNNPSALMTFNNDKVGIGTDLTNIQDYDEYKLFVKGKILCEKIKVIDDVPGADYVFDSNYKCMPLKDLEIFISKHKHLPEIQSADEMKKDGLDLTEMNILLLKKIEELTLYIIDIQKQNNKLNERISNLENK